MKFIYLLVLFLISSCSPPSYSPISILSEQEQELETLNQIQASFERNSQQEEFLRKRVSMIIKHHPEGKERTNALEEIKKELVFLEWEQSLLVKVYNERTLK